MFSARPEELFELTHRILQDGTPQGILPVYVFSETIGNQISPLRTSALFYLIEAVDIVAICDGETDHGAAGFTFCKEKLIELGVPKSNIVSISMPGDVNVNTLSEAEFLVRFARENNLGNIYITAAPFHQVRAFVTTVSVALREYPTLKIYNKVGMPLQWNEMAHHSQGVLTGLRKEFIYTEYDRLNEYHEKNDLVSCGEILDYLNWRDS